MPFEWFVALRYMRDAKGQTALILAAVSVGVSVIVFLSALIDGLQVSLIDKTLGSQPHVTLTVPREAPRPLVFDTDTQVISRTIQPSPQRLRSIDQWPNVLRDLDQVQGVIASSPMVVGAGFAVRSDSKSPVLIRGVDPERFLSIIDIEKKLVSGHVDVSGGKVIIGSTLASHLAVSVGDKIHLTTTEGADDVVTVAGIFKLGNEAVDKTWVLTSLRHAQALYALPGGVTTIEVKVADVFGAEVIAQEVSQRTGLEAKSWMKLNAELLTGLSAQSNSKNMIAQKSREIGILRAVGTPPRRVLIIFLIQGGVLGLLGSITGSGLGAMFAKLFESMMLEPDGSPRFPIRVDAQLLLFATVLATGVGLLSAVIPARQASRLDPATAIRNG